MDEPTGRNALNLRMVRKRQRAAYWDGEDELPDFSFEHLMESLGFVEFEPPKPRTVN